MKKRQPKATATGQDQFQIGPPKTLKIKRGRRAKKLPAQPGFSALKLIRYVPPREKDSPALKTSADMLRKRSQLLYDLLRSRAVRNQEYVEKFLNTLGIDPADYYRHAQSESQTGQQYNKTFQTERPLIVEVFDRCRFREITIKECLRQVCADLDEPIPWAMWEYFGGEWDSFTATSEAFPTFSLLDAVGAGTGFCCSEGRFSISVGTSVTDAAVIKEIGVRFSGTGSHNENGGSFGRVVAHSNFEIRSNAPPLGGPSQHLVPLGDRKVTEIDAFNNSGRTSPFPWLPSHRSQVMNMPVLRDHEFMIDWLLEYEVSASGYDGFAALGFDMKVIPYIIYETCHEEWKQVRHFVMEVADWMSKRP